MLRLVEIVAGGGEVVRLDEVAEQARARRARPSEARDPAQPTLAQEQRAQLPNAQASRRELPEDARQLWRVLRYINALQGTSQDLSTDLASQYGAREVRAQLIGALSYLGRFAEELARHEAGEPPDR